MTCSHDLVPHHSFFQQDDIHYDNINSNAWKLHIIMWTNNYEYVLLQEQVNVFPWNLFSSNIIPTLWFCCGKRMYLYFVLHTFLNCMVLCCFTYSFTWILIILAASDTSRITLCKLSGVIHCKIHANLTLSSSDDQSNFPISKLRCRMRTWLLDIQT